jgi:hypothetical protein
MHKPITLGVAPCASPGLYPRYDLAFSRDASVRNPDLSIVLFGYFISALGGYHVPVVLYCKGWADDWSGQSKHVMIEASVLSKSTCKGHACSGRESCCLRNVDFGRLKMS